MSNLKIWKVSHGPNDISWDVFVKMKKDHQVSVHSNTKAKAASSSSQGNDFVNIANEGDFFYLCRGNTSIELIGKFVGSCEIDNDGWAYRRYEMIAESIKKNVSYDGDKRWWTPSDNSTFIQVKDINEFNDFILSPFFGFTNDILKDMDTIQAIANQLEANHNIIMHGAPGTGKTYRTKDIATLLMGWGVYKNLDNAQKGEFDTRYKMVQFHPSYDYTDFVEGLRPIKKDDNVGFERKDGVFKAFCKKALKAYNESADKANAPKYVFVIDEINRGDMSKIFGELFFSMDPGYRGEDGKVDTQYQNLIDTDPDTNQEDVFKDGFYVPNNVYVIGTMNDIDRSVESMDFAMRRRFAFMEITAEESQSMLTLEAFRKVNAENADKAYAEVDELKKRMNALNAEIISSQIGLSTDYQIGAAYFLKFALYADQDKDQSYRSLWKNHLKSVITEYLRGTGDERSKFDKLKAAYDNGKTQNN